MATSVSFLALTAGRLERINRVSDWVFWFVITKVGARSFLIVFVMVDRRAHGGRQLMRE